MLTQEDKDTLNKMSNEALNELTAYKILKKGWDSYGGEPVDHGLVERVKTIVQICFGVFEQFEIVPSEVCPGVASDGSLDLDFEIDNRTLILTFYNDDLIRCYQSKKQGEHHEVTMTDTARNLLHVLSWLVGPDHRLPKLK